MSRSLKKGYYVEERLLRKVEDRKAGGKPKVAIKTWSRASIVIPEFIGLNFLVHKGNDFTMVHISHSMVGHKLGEFAPTRAFSKHTAVTKRSRQKIK